MTTFFTEVRQTLVLISVAAMFMGALVGSLLIFHGSIILPLGIALVVIASIAVTTRVLARHGSGLGSCQLAKKTNTLFYNLIYSFIASQQYHK